MSTEALQAQHHHLQLPQRKDSLNVPAAVAAAAVAAVQERRGSTESAYYSIYSDGDRRGSWQDGDSILDSAAAAASTEGGAAVRRTSSSSALCEECEIRRFRPTDRSPFHTRAHAEAVMAEFTSLHGERAAAAAAAGAAWNPPPASVSPSPATSTSAKPQAVLLLPPTPSSKPHSPHCLQLAPPVSPSVSVEPLPTLAEEDSQADQQLPDSFEGSIGLAGRHNTVSSCDLRRNRRLSHRESVAQAAPTSKGSSAAADPMSPRQVTAASLTSTVSASKRKFSLDASTVTTPSLGGRPGQLLRRPSVAGGAPGGLFRLFHHEATPEELAVFNQSRRGSKTGTLLGDEAASPPPPDQNPSRLFRRFQSTDDDYFVALKVEKQPAESLPAFVGDRQKLLSVGEDGSTVVTELSQIPEVSTPSSNSDADTITPAATTGSEDATDAPATGTESEIEIALRLAKTSPFAYVPPAQLQAAPAADCRAPERRRPSAGVVSTTQRRNSDWRRCVSEMSTASKKSSRSSSTGGEVGVGLGGGSRVKQLMARFGDGQ